MISAKSIAVALLFVSTSVFSLPTPGNIPQADSPIHPPIHSIFSPGRREVPQEHSHEFVLTSVRASLADDNPFGFKDPVFGVLGNANGAVGLGTFTDIECQQTAIADQAFTNAKKKGDVQGMVDALTYRALERNTATIGTKSNPCQSFTPVNPEVAALQQHQDPASPGAQDLNKSIVLELARQIKSIGGNPQDALLSGTFAPGDAAQDPTGRGNTCDDSNDPRGCIFTQNKLVNDATPEEIDAAVADTAANRSREGRGRKDRGRDGRGRDGRGRDGRGRH